MTGTIADNLGRSSGLIKSAGGGGKIGQVLNVIQPAVVSTTGTSYADLTGMTQAITPVATSSKILWSYDLLIATITQYLHIQIVYGDASALTTQAIGDAASNRTRATSAGIYNPQGDEGLHISMQGLDSPATTSSTTYKLQWFLSSGTAYLNRRNSDSDNATYDRGISSLTLMEVLA